MSIQSLSVFPSSYHTVLDKGRYPIYLLVSGLTLLFVLGRVDYILLGGEDWRTPPVEELIDLKAEILQ